MARIDVGVHTGGVGSARLPLSVHTGGVGSACLPLSVHTGGVGSARLPLSVHTGGVGSACLPLSVHTGGVGSACSVVDSSAAPGPRLDEYGTFDPGAACLASLPTPGTDGHTVVMIPDTQIL